MTVSEPQWVVNERKWNSETTIINPGPFKPVENDRPCPAKLRHRLGVWECHRVIRAGRTKHAGTHDFHEELDNQEVAL